MINLTEAVKNDVEFKYFRDGAMWYETCNGDLFPVPSGDAGSATFNRTERGMYLMRWMRKWNDVQKSEGDAEGV